MNKNVLKRFCSAIAVACLFFAFAAVADAAVYGDADGDSAVTAADARQILRASVGLEQFTAEQSTLADIDGNGIISAADARSALRMSVNLDEIKHYYEQVILKEPDCTEKGELEFVCTECEDRYTEDIEALGHDYSEPEVLVQVTCEEDGLEKYTCSRCGFSEEIPVEGGHIWDPEKATCTEDQYCIRGEHTGELRYGHTTDWGKCGNCGIFVTDKNAEAAAVVKDNYNKGFTDVEKAYGYIEKTQGAYSWLQTYTASAKPYYESARAYYQAAYDACADISELQSVKTDIGKILSNLDGILAQTEVILAHGYIGNEDTYFALVGPIDDLNYILEDSIKDVNNSLKGKIIW